MAASELAEPGIFVAFEENSRQIVQSVVALPPPVTH